MDTSGNVSATNTVSLVYVPSAILKVSTNGVGFLSTNYNGASLQVGNSYSITATAGTSFVFTNWTGGTNLPLSVLTNGPTVQFVMETNLMLQANFVDTKKPTISITNVPAGLSVSNAAFMVKGTASDNWQVTNVFYSLNSGSWSNAVTVNNWSNWTAAVTLTPGTNTIAAYAMDPVGDASLTANVNLFFVVTNQLQVRMTGLGTISPNYSNAWLEIGRNYSITSAPASGFKFTNWVTSTNWIGGATTTKTNLPFMMASNLTLQVTFAGCDQADPGHHRADCRQAHDQCPGNGRGHGQRQLESQRGLVSVDQQDFDRRNVEPRHHHQQLYQLDHHHHPGRRHQHGEGVCGGSGRKLFHHEQCERALEQHVQAPAQFCH